MLNSSQFTTHIRGKTAVHKSCELSWLQQKHQAHIWQLDTTAERITNIDLGGIGSKSICCQNEYKR